MNASRPLCSTCFREPREPRSARCADCGPGRIMTPPLRASSPMDHAAELLGGAQELDAADREDDHR